MPDKIDKPSDTEVAKAIVQNIPATDNKDLIIKVGAAYVAARIIKRAIKKR